MTQGLEGLLTGHTLVKRYRIEEVCGRGGFAVVYRATDTRLGRPVAVKVITLTAEDPAQREELRQRLHREARAAASLPHHPHLVTVHDVGTDPELGLDFLVMELLEGENLSQALQRGRPPLQRALRILRDAAEGLAVGHRAGLVHRDVKPGNIFLARPHHDDPEAFRVCVLDYGIAQAIEDDQTVTRGMGANPLSPAFASPEQLRGDRDLSPSTDVFSLGVVGYQLLTGERPFAAEPGRMPTGWTVRRPLRELNPEVPPPVEEVVLRAMSVDPLDRYPDADAFAEALDAAMDEKGRGLAERVHAPPPGVLTIDEALEDDATMLAPALPVVPLRPRPPAAAGSADGPHRPVPPLRPRAHAAPRRGSRAPVVVVLALLLVAAAAWAAMGGLGGGGGESATVPVGGDSVAAAGGEVVTDDAGNPVDDTPPSRTGPDVNVPAGDGGGAPTAGGPAAPSTGAPPATAPPPQVQVTRPPVAPPAGAQPQPSAPPANEPPTPQPNPPVTQPQPTEPQAQPPQEPQPRPNPPLLGRPVEPEPLPPPPVIDPPRDTLFIPSPPARR